MNPNSNYRPDIDGLRAVAVILVLLFHLGLGIPGGYIGVDVFFVISGYLITGIISRQMERGEFSFMGFYARRARRILPAFLVVLLLFSIAALFILLPSDIERYAKSVMAALLSVSNFWFWSQGGYFGGISEMAPLLHTWSLAVEEQFYLVLPIALLLMHRWVPRWTRSLVLLACLGTFAAAAWFVPTRTPEVFYFSPFRAWELLLGSLLALYRLPVVAASLHRQWIAGAGLLLILGPAFAYTAETVFPGPAAALPCIGTALLIWVNASGESGVGRLLKSRALVFIGLISYSLYLWHWPLLVFAKHAVGGSLGLEVRIAIGLASVVLATLSWRFIETPFRSKAVATRRQMVAFSGISVAVLASMVSVVVLNHGLEGRFDAQVAALDRARIRDVVRGECIDLRGPLDTQTACRIGAAGQPSVLVWGDSYAHAMLPAFDAALKQLGVAGYFAAESGCPPLPAARVSFKGRDNWRCREFNDKVVQFLAGKTGVSRVVLAAAWDGYAVEASGYKLRVSGIDDSGASLKRGLEILAQDLTKAPHINELTVVGQVPSYGWSVPMKMLQSRLRNEPVAPPLTYTMWRQKSEISRRVFEELERSQQVTVIDSASWFCASGVCRYANDQGLPLYWDGGHINVAGAQFIAPMLMHALNAQVPTAGGADDAVLHPSVKNMSEKSVNAHAE